MRIEELFKKRDVLIKKISSRKILIISCDSSGAIGPKEGDYLKVDGEIVGKFIVRSAIMEVLSTGAKPICISCGMGVEPIPTGNGIVKGIKEEISKIGMDPERDLVLSSEKNFPTNQTGIGITAIGICLKEDLRIGKSKEGDIIVSIGLPLLGEEVLINEKEAANLEDLLCLLSIDWVHSIIPVGSKGIIYESNVLASESMLRAVFLKDLEIDIRKSAGPSTVLLATIEEKNFDILRKIIKKPLNKVARLITNDGQI